MAEELDRDVIFYSTHTANTLPVNLMNVLGLRNWRTFNFYVKYTNELLILAVEETVLQGTIDRLTEIGRCYGTETNEEKPKKMRISGNRPR